MRHLKYWIFLSVLLLSNLQQAQAYLVPSDTTYWTKSSRWIQYIYPREHENALNDLDHYMHYFKQKYDRSFTWALDETIKLTLASDQNQIANGFATVTPFLQTTHYPAGSELLDSFAQDSFMFALTSHETAHLYQLSAKSSLSSTVKSVLGNTVYLQTPLIVPIFVFPNALLPVFMLEGNAVLNESVLGHGGRLWSGDVRAEVLAQYRGGKTGPNRLINQQLDFPLQEDYHYGGYFFAYLAERFGLDETNRFYIRHAERDFWPFNMNKTFRRYFGVSYTRLIHDFEMWLAPMAQKQQMAEGQSLTRVFDRPRFNQDQNHIYFVSNPNGRGSNVLYQFARDQQKLVMQKTALPSGKAFFLEDRYYTVRSSKINPTQVKYALFDESLQPKSDTINFIYQDVRNDHILSVDANHSYRRAQLYKDGRFFDEAGTSAVLDANGKAYYFRQAGTEHILYRDREPLFKYKGYYGFPTEVGANGEVYFIAATNYGSSLFRWHNNVIERVFAADNVVEARWVRDNLFLVAATDSKGYQIQLLKAEPQAQNPAWYDYDLPNTMPPPPPNPPAPSLALKAEENEYSTLKQIRYSQANVQLGGGGWMGSVLLTDPLWWNQALLAARVQDHDRDIALAYIHRRHRLGWQFSTVYQDRVVSSISKPDVNVQSYSIFIGANYELFKWRRWNGEISIGPTFKHEGILKKPYDRRYGMLTALEFNYSRMDGRLAYEPYRHFSTTLHHSTEAAVDNNQKVNSTNGITMGVSGDIFSQSFLELSGSWTLAEIDSLQVAYLKDKLAENFRVDNYLSVGEAQEVREFNAKLKQVLDWSYYFPRFPLSLRRIAPFVSFKDTYTRKSYSDRLPVWREELGLGSEFEILIFNKMPTRLSTTFSTIKVAGSVTQEWQVAWGFSKSF